MRKFWALAPAVLSAIWCSQANALEQQSIIQPPSSEPIIQHKKLSDVIAASSVCSLHRALCEIESISDHEGAVGKLLISILEAHNFTVKKQYVPIQDSNSTEKHFNIFAYPDVSKYGISDSVGDYKVKPKVLLSSHIDTVPPHIPYSLSLPKSKSSREDILISGRGTVDDKACVAVQTQAALDLLSAGKISPTDVALLFVVDEEKSGIGMRTFSDSDLYKASNSAYKAVLFGEPTEAKLATGHKGITMVTVKAYGKAAHSGYPWLGRSANSMILPALLALDKLGDIPEEEGGLPRSEKYGKSTVNVGYMQGGVAGNVVPEYAVADVTFRLAGGTMPQVHELIENAIRKVDPEGLLELKFSQGYGPIPLDGDVDGFDTITVNYGTDVPNLEVAEGIKRYLYGPGSILVAHGRDEGLTVGAMEEALEGYKKLVAHALTL